MVRNTGVYLMLQSKIWSPTKKDVFELNFSPTESIFSQSAFFLITVSIKLHKVMYLSKMIQWSKKEMLNLNNTKSKVLLYGS